MKKRLAVIFLVILSLVLVVYSEPTYINSCQPLYEDNLTNSSDRKFILNQSVNSTGTCFSFHSKYLSLDCNNFKITGDGTGSGFYTLWGGENSNLSNCNFYNFYRGVNLDRASNMVIKNLSVYNSQFESIRLHSNGEGLRNNFFENILISNNSGSTGLALGAGGNYFKNLTVKESPNSELISIKSKDNNVLEDIILLGESDSSGQAIGLVFDVNNTIFRNVFINNTNVGIKFYFNPGGGNNTFENISIYETNSWIIRFDNQVPQLSQDNNFINSYFQDSSLITSFNWSYSQNFDNNRYGDISVLGGPLCFDESFNLTCDFRPNGYDFTGNVSSSTISSVFASQGFTSLISLIIILTYYFRRMYKY